MRKNPLSRLFVAFYHSIKRAYRFFIPSRNDRFVAKLRKQALEIDVLSSKYENMKDAELRQRTADLKDMLKEGKTLDDILVDAFALVREASWRIRGEKPYLVQLMGGIALHKGMISEMGTGEGKTLVATLPAFLNALEGKGVHVITVNDYLARRDAHNMGEIFRFLGLTVGCVAGNASHEAKHAAYNCDITYGTNHEVVFDYLRDNMVKNLSELVQRPFNFCIIDEVDNILIDEARTPCIISGQAMEASELCRYAHYIVEQLVEGDYEKDEKSRNVYLTEKGLEHLEEIFKTEGIITGNETIFDEQHVLVLHQLNQSLKAVHMFTEGIQYIVKEGEVLIVDEFTGRIMDGRRFSDGLHQALEAKENVDIQKENQTLATITYQKFFELYPKKSGMTGTAMTEAEEFAAIYKLPVVSIPPNRKSQKKLLDDRIYRTFQEKLEAIVKIVADCVERKQPILIGTVSVEKSEMFSQALLKEGIKHQVLNAKNHAREADIIAEAGVPGAVTIATNMAGRGTDIKLGGSFDSRLRKLDDPTEEMIEKLQADLARAGQIAREAGGLFVLGTERHESRRIDNQLVGRCGRQGDAGTALFVLSIEDPLMQIFGGKTLEKWLPKMEYGEVIEHPLLTRAMSKAQKRVEAYHFDARKNVLRYDSTVNDQSRIIYKERMEFMKDPDVVHIVENLIDNLIEDFAEKFDKTFDPVAFVEECHKTFNVDVEKEKLTSVKSRYDISKILHPLVNVRLESQKEILGLDALEHICRDVCLSTLDMLWRKHLTKMENLRNGIGLRSYGQKDPVNEFKREAFTEFEDMLFNFRKIVASCITHHKHIEGQDLESDEYLDNQEFGEQEIDLDDL